MATVTAITFNLFETIGLVQPRIELMIREPEQCVADRKPLRMQWVHRVDSSGRKVIRIQWTADKQREGMTTSARGSR